MGAGADDAIDEDGHAAGKSGGAPRRRGGGRPVGPVDSLSDSNAPTIRAAPIGTLTNRTPPPAQEAGEDARRGGGRRPLRWLLWPTRRQEPAPFVVLGEFRGQQAQGGRGQDGTTDALSGRGRRSAHRRFCARPPSRLNKVKAARAGEEDPASSEKVGGAPAEHEEAGEGERVGVDDPLLATSRHVQRGPHLGQCKR